MKEQSADMATGYRIGQEEERPSTSIVVTKKPREVALKITPEDLNVHEGVDKLITE